jgi:hypothetical protein
MPALSAQFTAHGWIEFTIGPSESSAKQPRGPIYYYSIIYYVYVQYALQFPSPT